MTQPTTTGAVALPPGYAVNQSESELFGTTFTATGPNGRILGSCCGGRTAKARAREIAFAHFGRRASADLDAAQATIAELVAALREAEVAMDNEANILSDHDPAYGDGVFIASAEHLTGVAMSARAALARAREVKP